MAQPDHIITNPRSGQRMIFRKTGKETNGTFVEIESFNPPTGEREPEHVHPYQESSAEIIAGKLHFRIDGKTQVVGPGEKVVIPAGVPHQFWNEESTEAHSIQRFSPALEIETFFITYFALVRDGKLNKKGLANIFLMSTVLLYHQNVIRLTKPPWIVQKMTYLALAPIGRLLGFKEKYE